MTSAVQNAEVRECCPGFVQEAVVSVFEVGP